MTPEQYASLKADIQINGVLVPIIRTKTGETIDGHHREKIAAELGIIDIPVRIVTGLGDEQQRLMAIRLNAHRRQLTGDQKKSLIRDELRRTPDISNNWLAELLSVDDKTVQSVRADLEAAGTITKVTEFRCKDGKKRKYRRNVQKEKQVAAEAVTLDAPALLSISTTSKEQHVAGPTAELGEPMVFLVPTSYSIPATLPLTLGDQTSFEDRLAERMVAHGIQGTTSALMALLADLGVDVKKLMAA